MLPDRHPRLSTVLGLILVGGLVSPPTSTVPGSATALPVLLGPAPLAAQSVEPRGAGPVLLELPASTRGLALGGAFHGGLRESDAVFASPGHLNNPTGMEVAAQSWETGATLIQMSAGTEWWSGGVALGVRALGYGTLVGPMGPVLPTEEGALRRGGLQEGVSELLLTGGYGRVVRGFRVGVAGSALQLRSGARRDMTGAVSVGAARSLGPVVVSAGVLNLGPGLTVPGPAVGAPDGEGGVQRNALDLAREGVIGAASQTRPVGPLDLSVAARLALQEDQSLTVGAGVEVSYWPIQGRTFTLRLGGRSPHSASTVQWWTLGGGFRGDRLGLDYAVVPFEEGSASHRIGLSFR